MADALLRTLLSLLATLAEFSMLLEKRVWSGREKGLVTKFLVMQIGRQSASSKSPTATAQ